MIDAKKTAFPESVTISIGIIGFLKQGTDCPFPFPLGQAARKNAQLGDGLFQFLLEVFLFFYSNGSAHLKLWGAFEARTTNCYSHGLVVWIVPNCIKAYVLYRKNLPIALLAAACNLCENTDFTEGCTTVFFKGEKKYTQLLFLVAPDAEGPLCKDSPIPKILRTAAPPSLG